MSHWLKKICLTLVCVLLGASPIFAKGDTLVVGLFQSPKNLDAQTVTDGLSFSAAGQVIEMLVRQMPDGSVEPWLAERWELAPDRMSAKFYLKKNVKFHNGETMTADDVVFTFKRALSPFGMAIRTHTTLINDVEKVDDYTVNLKCKLPIGQVALLSLSHPWAGILSQKAVEKYGKDYSQNPVGTGKFMFRRWLIGNRIEYERFDGYHGEKAKFKNLVLRTITEGAMRTIELESGACDIILDPAPIDFPRIKNNPDLVALTVASGRTWHVGWDTTKAPFDNLKVRQAMSMAVNRAAICKVAFHGLALPSRGMTTSACKYNKYDSTKPFLEDPAAAKKLLAEAGFPDGFKMKLMIAERTEHVNIATILQANFKEIGIDVELDVLEWGALQEAVRKPGHTPYLNNWWAGTPALDPYFLLQPPFHSSGIPATNRSYYVNKEVDALFEKGASLEDGPEREKIYGEIWDILNRDLPWLALVEMQTPYGQVKELRGINHNPGTLNYYCDAYFEGN